jgi:type II secretory pathway pseudopilin PulG
MAKRTGEEGYILVAVIFMLALLIISLAVAAPQVAKDIQRDRELETMQRGKQYIRAIRLYYWKNGQQYPPSVDALLKTNNIKYLRKKYIDPTTGKEEWKAIHLGQNKAPTVMGFFGQPLTGAGGASTVAGATSATDMTSATTTAGASGATGSTGSAGSTGSTGSIGGTNASTFGSGQTFGGIIIGFSPNSPKQSILVYKKKNHYNEWEFVYDPIMEKMIMSSGAGVGTPPTQ